MTDLPLHVISETAATITLGWTPPAGAAGYTFHADARRSSTLDGSRSTVKFAKGAAAYRVVALGVLAEGEYPPPVAPSPAFGTKLFEGFEWALEEPTGPVVSVDTNHGLISALSSGADIIDGGGLTFRPGQIILPAHNEFRVVRNANFVDSRVVKANLSKWRLRKVGIDKGAPEDNFKGDSGGYIDIDQCDFHHAPRQGVLLYMNDVLIRDTRIHHNGTSSTNNQYHGIYTSQGQRLRMWKTMLYGNTAYQGQFYPHWHQALVSACTAYGGVSRGGFVVGSDTPTGSPVDPSATSDIRFIGCIAAGAPGYGFDQWLQAHRVSIEDCLGWANVKGDVTASLSSSIVRFKHGDPKFKDPANGDFSLLPGSAAKGIIDPSLWAYTPHPDAGAWAA